jgi:hypothetical protein
MPIQNRMQQRPGAILDYDILGLAQRRHEITQQTTKEDDMNSWYAKSDDTSTIDIYISDELEKRAPRLQRKEPTAFEALVSRLLAHSVPMTDEERARRIDHALAPLPHDASIAELLHALTEAGVFASPRSLMCDAINRFNRHHQQMETKQQRDLAARRCNPSYSMY